METIQVFRAENNQHQVHEVIATAQERLIEMRRERGLPVVGAIENLRLWRQRHHDPADGGATE